MTKMRIFLCLVLMAGQTSFAQIQSDFAYSISDIKSLLSDKNSGSLQRPPKGHPDHLVFEIVESLLSEKESPDKVIQRLELLLQTQNFAGIVTPGQNLAVGASGSISLWRDTAYLILGRSYLAKSDFNKALHFYQGVPLSSPLSELAMIEKGWSLLADGQHQKAQEHMQAFPSKNFESKVLQSERILLNSFVSLKQSRPQETIRMLETLRVQQSFHKAWQKSLAAKILAQAYFESYLENSKNPEFDKKPMIKKIISLAEEVPLVERDAKFSFLAGEAYWHLASIYRIEDPVKRKPEWMSALALAEKWLLPWADKSIENGKALMEEEAFFFSAVVLWEQEKQADALSRLDQLPKLFPNGEYREDTYQLIGDYLFDKKSFSKALTPYSALVAVGSPEKATYGQYKASWSFFNLGQKKKAIDHMKRLVVHYRSNAAEKVKPLELEAQRDLILFLAESKLFPQAISELKSVDYENAEWPLVKEDLARTYGQIGRYKEAVHAWQDLLALGPQPRSFFWLHELVQAHLALGERSEIPTALNQHAPKLLATKSINDSSEMKEFEQKVVNLILTIHREARKTDDKAIWTVTDQLYDFFFKNMAFSMVSPIWYHGAQRLEARGKSWDSISWYQREAAISKSDLREDSGHSVLRILKLSMDKQSLNPEAGRELYKQAGEKAWWYIETFPKSSERSFADLLFMEASYFQGPETKGQESKGHTYFLSLIEKQSSEHVKGLFERETKRLYKAQKWDLLFKLSRDTEKRTTAWRDAAFESKLKLIQQESAFQLGFLDKDLQSSRNWYEIALSIEADRSLQIRAWNNLFQSFKLPDDNKIFFEKWNKFSSIHFSSLKKDDQALLYNLWIKAAQAFQQVGRPYDQAQALVRAGELSDSGEERKKIYWDAAVIFGSYLDFPSLQKAEAKLAEDYHKLNLDQEIIKARLYYLNGKYLESWSVLKPHLDERDKPALWLLVSDLLRVEDNLAWKNEVMVHLKQRHSKLKDNSVLIGAWALVFGAEFLNAEFPKITPRAPAQEAPSTTSNTISESEILKDKLKSVTITLGNLSELKKAMKSELESPLMERRIAAACHMPELSRGSVENLNSLRQPSLSLPEWQVFIGRLDSKVSEIQATADAEAKVCEEARFKLRFLTQASKKFWCPNTVCPDKERITTKDLVSWDLKALDKKWTLKERVFHLLQQGAFSSAEYWADLAPSEEERAFLNGLVRLARRDLWNSVAFMETVKKHPEYREVVEYLHNRWEDNPANKDRLPAWSKPLWKDR